MSSGGGDSGESSRDGSQDGSENESHKAQSRLVDILHGLLKDRAEDRRIMKAMEARLARLEESQQPLKSGPSPSGAKPDGRDDVSLRSPVSAPAAASSTPVSRSGGGDGLDGGGRGVAAAAATAAAATSSARAGLSFGNDGDDGAISRGSLAGRRYTFVGDQTQLASVVASVQEYIVHPDRRDDNVHPHEPEGVMLRPKALTHVDEIITRYVRGLAQGRTITPACHIEINSGAFAKTDSSVRVTRTQLSAIATEQLSMYKATLTQARALTPSVIQQYIQAATMRNINNPILLGRVLLEAVLARQDMPQVKTSLTGRYGVRTDGTLNPYTAASYPNILDMWEDSHTASTRTAAVDSAALTRVQEYERLKQPENQSSRLFVQAKFQCLLELVQDAYNGTLPASAAQLVHAKAITLTRDLEQPGVLRQSFAFLFRADQESPTPTVVSMSMEVASYDPDTMCQATTVAMRSAWQAMDVMARRDDEEAERYALFQRVAQRQQQPQHHEHHEPPQQQPQQQSQHRQQQQMSAQPRGQQHHRAATDELAGGSPIFLPDVDRSAPCRRKWCLRHLAPHTNGGVVECGAWCRSTGRGYKCPNDGVIVDDHSTGLHFFRPTCERVPSGRAGGGFPASDAGGTGEAGASAHDPSG